NLAQSARPAATPSSARSPELAARSHHRHWGLPPWRLRISNKSRRCNAFMSAPRADATWHASWNQGGGGVSMSHRTVEIVLGRLATDELMRRRFREAPMLALREVMASGLELSPVELAALEKLDPADLQRFAQALDSRLQKADLERY